MYVDIVPNRNSRPAILLREGWREGKRVRKRTIANLTNWPPDKIETLRRTLKNETLVAPGDAFHIVRSRPHGHVAAVLGSLRQLELDRLIAAKPSRQRELAVAMIVARILEPRSELATARGLCDEALSHTLGEVLALDSVDADALYSTLDWLLRRQGALEKQLAQRHLANGALVLYDVTSTWVEGRCCSCDGQRGQAQIVFGLLCNAQGCPVAVAVFEGNTADPATLSAQIAKLRTRFGLARMALVGDHGRLPSARIREEIQPAGLDWISALRAPAIRALASGGMLQLSLFEERDLAEIQHPDFPGERLLACRNPLLAAERARQREALLQAAERDLNTVLAATQRTQRPLAGRDRIGRRTDQVIAKHKMAQHFDLEIAADGFAFQRNRERIAQEAQFDGLSVIRTSLPASELSAADTVRAYHRFSRVERACRSFQTVGLQVRPIDHYRPERVRAQVLLGMLAYHVEWHMRRQLAPLLCAVDASQGTPRHSFRTLLNDLATIAQNRVQPQLGQAQPFDLLTRPTPLQRQALDLLGLRL